MRRPDWLFPLAELTRAEWRLREQSTPMGFLWALLHPALLCAAVWATSGPWAAPGRAAPLAALAVGVLQFGFFASATGQGAGSLLRRKALIRAYPAPPWIVVASSTLCVALSHAAAACLGLALWAAVGPGPSIGWLLAPALYAASVAMALGVSLALAPAALRHPDLPRTWAAGLTVLFFLTPILYDPGQLPGRRRLLADLNPLAHLIEASRACLVQGLRPSAASLTAVAAAALLSLAAGAALFRAQRDRLRESLAR